MVPNIPHHFDKRPGDYPTNKKPKYGWRDDSGRPIHDIAADGTPICGRIRAKTKTPCQCRILCANGRCGLPGHGGGHVKGPLKHGRYSKFLPTRLAARYEAAINDDVLEYLRENVAVVVAMTQGKFQEFGEHSSAELWKAAQKACKAALAAMGRTRNPQANAALKELDAILTNGGGMQQKESESIKLMAEASRLGKAELARMQKLGQFITPQEAMANRAHWISLISKYVDHSALPKLADEIRTTGFARFG